MNANFRKSDLNRNEKFPFISVVIPVYKDPSGLKDTLESLVVQDYSIDKFEIIVADNGSFDETLDVANSFKAKYPDLVKIVIEDEIQSSYAARNKGVKAAKGDVIAFIDADMSVYNDCLSLIATSMNMHEVDYLACNVVIYSENESIFSLYNKITGFPIEECINASHFCPTCCLVTARKIFDDVGFFDFRLMSGGDFEFGNRVFRMGKKMYYDPDILMKHPARSSFRQLFKKSFRIGRGYSQLAYYHPVNHREKNRNVLNPRHYFPTPPWKFLRIMCENRTWNEASYGEKVGVYLISWMFKVGTHLGYIYENKMRSRQI